MVSEVNTFKKSKTVIASSPSNMLTLLFSTSKQLKEFQLFELNISCFPSYFLFFYTCFKMSSIKGHGWKRKFDSGKTLVDIGPQEAFKERFSYRQLLIHVFDMVKLPNAEPSLFLVRRNLPLSGLWGCSPGQRPFTGLRKGQEQEDPPPRVLVSSREYSCLLLGLGKPAARRRAGPAELS